MPNNDRPQPSLGDVRQALLDVQRWLSEQEADADRADLLQASLGQFVSPVRDREWREQSAPLRRLQTLDHGAPVSPFTVARELGHGGTRLVERIYGHLGEARHRSEVVEYRVEAFPTLADRLAQHGFVTTPGPEMARFDTNSGTIGSGDPVDEAANL